MTKLLAVGIVAFSVVVAACGGIATTTRPSGTVAAPTLPPATAAATPEPTARVLVGVSLPSKSVRWTVDGEALAASLEGLGYAVDVRYAEDAAATQASQVEAMLDDGARLLVIAPVDDSALTDTIRKAADGGVRVIAYDRLVRNSTGVDYYATFDPFKIGILQAGSIVAALGLPAAKGPFTIELFAGAPGDADAEALFAGAMSILAPYLRDGTLVVGSGERLFPDQVGTSKWNPASAEARMDNLLAAYGPGARVDAVLSPDDAIGRGIIASLRRAGYYTPERPGPAVSGQGAEILSVKSILAGEQTSTVFRDGRVLAARVATMADQLLRGRTVDVNDATSYDNGARIVPALVLDAVIVTRDTVQATLIDSGYLDPEDLR